MTETVTVKSFGNPKAWDHGITYWDVVFDRNGTDFSCTWGKKDTEPSVGETVEGEFFEKNGDWRFRKASKPQSGTPSSEVRTGSAGSSNSGKREWKPESQYDPEKTARIGRAHAQHMGILTCDAMGLFESVSASQIESKLKDWIDFYEKDVNQAGEAARQTPGNATPGVRESAATSLASAPPASASQPADPTLTEIEQALDSAGLMGPARSQVASYMLSQLSTEQQVNTIRKLTGSNPEAQSSALGSLKTLTEKWSGKPLPIGDLADGSDLPF